MQPRMQRKYMLGAFKAAKQALERRSKKRSGSTEPAEKDAAGNRRIIDALKK